MLISTAAPPESYISISFAKSIEVNKKRDNSFMIVTPDCVYNFQADSKEVQLLGVLLIQSGYGKMDGSTTEDR